MAENHLAYTTLSGSNVRTFLQGYITCDLDNLRSGVAMPMAITEIKGRVVANGWVAEETDTLVLVMHASVVDIVEQHLLPYLRFARCELIVDPTPFYVTQNLEERSTEFSVSGRKFRFTDEKTAAYDLNRFQIETRYALVTEPTSGKFLPQMLNLTEFDAVSFTKGCYLGQEVVARAQHRGQVKRRLLAASYDGCDLVIGEQVQTESGEKAVVVVRSKDSALVVVSTTENTNEIRLVSEQIA